MHVSAFYASSVQLGTHPHVCCTNNTSIFYLAYSTAPLNKHFFVCHPINA